MPIDLYGYTQWIHTVPLFFRWRVVSVVPMNLQADERAFQTLLELIRTREIRPGERLYETELAERFSMSRTPLRHALGRLTAEGLLSKTPGRKGYFMPPLTRQDMTEVYHARAALEGMAVTLLAGRLPSDLSAELSTIITQQKKLYANGSRRGEYAALNGTFHFALVRGSGNRYLLRSFAPVFWRSIMYTLLYASFYTGIEDIESGNSPRRPSWKQHEEIVSVLESGEGEQARKIIEAHVLENCEYWKEGEGRELGGAVPYGHVLP